MKKILHHISLACLCLCTYAVSAQTGITNTGILKVSSTSDTLYIKGDLTNASTATLTNNGSLYVKGSVTNDQASMSAGTGTLYMTGTLAQSVNGSAAFKTWNFVSDNPVGILLNNDLSVSGLHTFRNGIIQTADSAAYLIYESGATYTGDGDTRHVNGWVKKIGNSDFTFPVGNGTWERTASITDLSSPNTEVVARYYTGGMNQFSLDAPLIAADSNEYWSINRVREGHFKVNLNWDNNKARFYNVLLKDILVSEYHNGKWHSLGGASSGVVATTGSVRASGASNNSSSKYTFGFTSYPLPVRLITFSGFRQNKVSMLQWTADNEELGGSYEIQRSTNGVQYNTIGTVAAWNSGRTSNYNFRDPVVFSGTIYYRLKMQDLAGKGSFSNVITLTEGVADAGSFMIPNPVKDAVTVISHAGPSGEFAYSIYNAGGQNVQKGMITIVQNGQVKFPLTGSISNGIYTLELKNATTTFRQQILVKQ